MRGLAGAQASVLLLASLSSVGAKFVPADERGLQPMHSKKHHSNKHHEHRSSEPQPQAYAPTQCPYYNRRPGAALLFEEGAMEEDGAYDRA